MSTCDNCDKTTWDGIYCGKYRICQSCLDSILEKHFERENNERKREQYKRSSA